MFHTGAGSGELIRNLRDLCSKPRRPSRRKNSWCTLQRLSPADVLEDRLLLSGTSLDHFQNSPSKTRNLLPQIADEQAILGCLRWQDDAVRCEDRRGCRMDWQRDTEPTWGESGVGDEETTRVRGVGRTTGEEGQRGVAGA